MESLRYVVDNIYNYLQTRSMNHKMTGAQDMARTIKAKHDLFFLHATLDPVDVDLFILYYLKYMNKYYSELEEMIVTNRFVVLNENILKTARLYDKATIQFLSINNNSDNFMKGFLVNDPE